MTRILIIRFSSIGDIVLTSPVIRMLKEQLDGEVEIHYLTKNSFAGILEANPHIHKIWTLDEKLDDVLGELGKIEFDYLIDLHRNLRTALVKKKIKGLYFSFDKLNFKKWLLVNFGIDKLPRIHIADRYLASLVPFGLKDDKKGLDYFIPQGTQVNLGPYGYKQEEYLVWVIGASHPGKRFSAAKVTQILNSYKGKVILLGGPADKAMSEEIMANIECHILNMVGRCSLHESAYLIQHAHTVLTPDTGMMHIASALKKKVISVWGCTVPEFGMYPYYPGEGSQIIEPDHLKKRPCSKLGNRCKYAKKCIEQIPNERVSKAISR
jgi:ADP-heptose:LPS heptosyltransferase